MGSHISQDSRLRTDFKSAAVRSYPTSLPANRSMLYQAWQSGIIIESVMMQNPRGGSMPSILRRPRWLHKIEIGSLSRKRGPGKNNVQLELSHRKGA